MPVNLQSNFCIPLQQVKQNLSSSWISKPAISVYSSLLSVNLLPLLLSWIFTFRFMNLCNCSGPRLIHSRNLSATSATTLIISVLLDWFQAADTTSTINAKKKLSFYDLLSCQWLWRGEEGGDISHYFPSCLLHSFNFPLFICTCYWLLGWSFSSWTAHILLMKAYGFFHSYVI